MQENKNIHKYYFLDGNKIQESLKKDLAVEIDKLTINNWGNFGETFILSHVIKSKYILLARDNNNELVGIASISEKVLSGIKILYFELTVIDKAYQSRGLSFKMNKVLIQKIIVKEFFAGKFYLEFMVISPNMKVLGSLANKSSFIYPDPYKLNIKTGKIPSADIETWLMSQELVRKSENPGRKLVRDGCVLYDSYKETPDLIYKKNDWPKYCDEIVNIFGEKYLEYEKETGKELIIRVKFNLRSILRGLLK